MFVLKSLGFRKLGHSSEMRNDASWGFKGLRIEVHVSGTGASLTDSD